MEINLFTVIAWVVAGLLAMINIFFLESKIGIAILYFLCWFTLMINLISKL
jgi:hypothetical protein